MGSDTLDTMAGNGRGGLSEIPGEVHDDEILHRRIHPSFVRPDGSISSQAFRDPEMSVDRAWYTTIEDTLLAYEDYGLAALIAVDARELDQEVVADRLLLNPAHALVKGRKTKSISRRLARSSSWVLPPSDQAA